jgi:predicted phosphohydrolase
LEKIASRSPDAVLITGDISEGDDVVFQLKRMSEAVNLPLYFVLGNHDFYQSDISSTRENVRNACDQNSLLNYLTDSPPLQLHDSVYLIGEDGWGDATRGNYEASPIRLNDFALIDDFAREDASKWKSLLQEQGKQSADRLRKQLDQVPSETTHLIIATHVPPHCESCWYEGRTTDENWAPFFVCGQVGDVLEQFACENTTIKLHVLCGHTHHAGTAELSENLIVYTGAAVYGQPDLEACLEIEPSRCKIQLIS